MKKVEIYGHEKKDKNIMAIQCSNVGRKKKKPADRKTYAMKIMMSPKERAEIEAAALAADMETSTWMRRKILEVIRQKNQAK